MTEFYTTVRNGRRRGWVSRYDPRACALDFPRVFEGEPGMRARAERLGERTYELTEFLTKVSWTARRPRVYAFATALAARVLRLLGGRDGMIGSLPFGGEWTRGRYFPAPASGRTFRALYAARPKRAPVR